MPSGGISFDAGQGGQDQAGKRLRLLKARAPQQQADDRTAAASHEEISRRPAGRLDHAQPRLIAPAEDVFAFDQPDISAAEHFLLPGF